ncbi:MAG: thiol:disulfide interchange protein DsbA/DsbL [Proteobacteria bacterium]|nr:thiol:disulfide interchange protein DsbA/DsbL [Pseudomonadota bacterium]
MHAKRIGSRVLAVIALLALTAMLAACARAADALPVLGTDYFKIEVATPASGAKVQVVEVFGHGCPICARFQPYLVAWEKKLPADVEFSYLPAAFGPDPEHCWDDFARAFFAAQMMGIEAKSHDGIYKAKFEQGRIETCAAIPAAYADYGPDPTVFASTMNSFPVNAKMVADHDQVLRWGVDGTPTMVVDGTWRVVMTRGGGPEGMLRTVDWLIARQRPLHHPAPAHSNQRKR